MKFLRNDFVNKEIIGVILCFYRSGVLWNVIECYGMLSNVMECYGMLWNVIECYGMLWNVMECYGILPNFLPFDFTCFIANKRPEETP